eukprot:TRINITY_DN43950_c0_g1_i1.p1 TRINITY_DN43950_c0_g1~~TRINITY_DN43950_c0_g1_i1.p1  ORF type:complete len:139 (-),score=22.35 TRINITY_DN43950_c0_g1_i1:309-725(-)
MPPRRPSVGSPSKRPRDGGKSRIEHPSGKAVREFISWAKQGSVNAGACHFKSESTMLVRTIAQDCMQRLIEGTVAIAHRRVGGEEMSVSVEEEDVRSAILELGWGGMCDVKPKPGQRPVVVNPALLEPAPAAGYRAKP